MDRITPPAPAALRRRYLTAYRGWVLLTLAATILGLGSLAYGVSGRIFAARLAEEAPWPTLLAVDAIGVTVALLLGPWQFVPGLRWRWPRVHGWLGLGYAGSAMTAAILTVALAWDVDAGPAATMSLLVLGSAWLIATMLDMAQVWHGNAGAYRRWMVRGFALALATVGLRFCCVLDVPFAAGCLALISAIMALAMWLGRTGDTAMGPRHDRRMRPAPRALELGVEITIETLDGWIPPRSSFPAPGRGQMPR